MIVIGIDPGIKGGFSAVIDDGTLIRHTEVPIIKTPSKNRKRLKKNKNAMDTDYDILEIYNTFKNWFSIDRNTHFVIEDVHTMPKQGIVSSGKFMRGKGILEASAVAVAGTYERVHLVSPRKWKKFHGLLKTEKVAAQILAQKYFGISLSSGEADAALMALWLFDFINQ